MAREFGSRELHVGHVIVDGVIDGDPGHERFPQLKERLAADGMLAPDYIAGAPPPGAKRVDARVALRPHKESF
jgi:hypothetical protein